MRTNIWMLLVGMVASSLSFVAAAMERLVRERNADALVVAAPPRTLADLRQAFHTVVERRIIAEVDKDQTKHPVGEIEKHLVAH